MHIELIVASSKAPPAPEGGWDQIELGALELYQQNPEDWLDITHPYLGERPCYLLHVRCTLSNQEEAWILCRALADASAGIVMERVPVLLPAVYRLRYRGEFSQLSWETLLRHAGALLPSMPAAGLYA